MPTEKEKEVADAIEKAGSAIEPPDGTKDLPLGNVWSEEDEVAVEHPVVPPHPI